MQNDKFHGFENVSLRPKDVTALQSEVKQIAGWGVEIVSGGGDGAELCFAGGDEDPFAASSRAVPCRAGELYIGRFQRFGVRWAATGIASSSGVTRETKLRVYKDRGIARVHLLSGDMLKVERKLLRTHNHTLAGGNLAAGSSHLIFQTSDYLPAAKDHWTDPGLGVPFREEEGFLEIVLGASGAAGGAGITTAPLLIVYAQHRLQNVTGARSLWWLQKLQQRPSGAGMPASWATSWQWSLAPVAFTTLGAASPAIFTRLTYPPNGTRIEIFNPSENAEALQWEAAVYVRGQ